MKNCNIFLTYESRPESNTRFEITTIQMHFGKIDMNKARRAFISTFYRVIWLLYVDGYYFLHDFRIY